MVIGIDGRSVLDTPISGVGEYTQNLLGALCTLQTDNEYHIFLNALKTSSIDRSRERLPLRAHHHIARLPNKLLNTLFTLHVFNLEYFTGCVNHFFLPNHIFVSLLPNTAYTITVHDLSFEIFPHYYSAKGRLWHTVVDPLRLYRNAKHIIAVSQSTKQDLVRVAGISEEKIHVIYSGIHERFFQFKNLQAYAKYEHAYALPEQYILYLGTIEKRKNVLGLIRAFELAKKNPALKDTYLLIAGKCGFGFSNIQKAVSSSSHSSHIRFLGYVEPEAKPYLYHRAQCFVYPSFYEGFGFPPLEAMAIGTPVITSNSSSLPEIVGDAAIVIDPYHISELAAAMCELLQNGALTGIMRERGKKIAARYQWETCARETMKVLEH